MNSATDPGRPLRKDAERNRQRILRRRGRGLHRAGLEASLDDVARHAGVGVATVYRRFPDKASLADALFEERINALAGLADQALDAAGPVGRAGGLPGPPRPRCSPATAACGRS